MADTYSTTHQAFASKVFGYLERMDREASSYRMIHSLRIPNGLEFYGEHARTREEKAPKLYHWSFATASRIGELLEHTNPEVNCCIKQQYPGGLKSADLLVLDFRDRMIWMELRPIVRYSRDGGRFRPNDRFHTVLTSVSEASAFADVGALREVLALDKRYVGCFLLVGFDVADEPGLRIEVSDIARFKTLANLGGWSEFYREWTSELHTSHCRLSGLKNTCRVQCWLWMHDALELQKPKNQRALKLVESFVQTSDWNDTWSQLVLQLIKPLNLDRLGVDEHKLTENAQAALRAHWPESYNNRDLWLSRAGPWCRQDGMQRIIEIVTATADDMLNAHANPFNLNF